MIQTAVIKLAAGISAGKHSFTEFTVREALDRDEEDVIKAHGKKSGLALELALVARRVTKYAGTDGPMSADLLSMLTDTDWLLVVEQISAFDERLRADALAKIDVDGSAAIDMVSGLTVDGAAVTRFVIRETTLKDLLAAQEETNSAEGGDFTRAALARRIVKFGDREGAPDPAVFRDLTLTDGWLIRLQVEKFDNRLLADAMAEIGLPAGRE